MTKTQRGFACVGLDNPKSEPNVGGVMRACSVYGAAQVIVSGTRFKSIKRLPTDTVKTWKHMPVIETADIFDALPHDCVPVAVDLVEGAVSLVDFVHPERAFYIFGAEDQTLGARILDRCRDKVMIPTAYCMNLAATVNVVLYDRMAKQIIRRTYGVPN